MKVRTERISRERFIRLGSALGMSIVGASALTACEDNRADTNQSNAKVSGANTSKGGQEIARVSKVPAGSAVNFQASGQPAVLVHLKSGGFAAYSRICTHQGCTVVYQNGKLACPCHGSVFDPSKGGAVLYGPAQTPLPHIPIKVHSGGIYRA